MTTTPVSNEELQDDRLLSRNERTLVVRQQLADGQTVIIKRAFSTQGQARLNHEASMLQRLRGVPGVVQLAPEQGVEGLRLEDVHGQPLGQWLADRSPTIEEILTLAIGMAQALARVHHLGILHKDINPSNVLVTGPDLKVVLIDFNIASCFVQERLSFSHESNIEGTLAYMSPEQTGRTGRAIDQRSDLYALGATLYEMTTGRRPFESDDLLEMIHDHLVRQPLPPAALAPHLPEALSDIILRLLEKEADRRYQSAEGLARDLVRLQEQIQEGHAHPFVLGQDDFPLRLVPPSALVGREAELSTLSDSLIQAGQGRSRALLVAGAPGVGKSALINELQPLVSARRGWFVTGKFEQYQRDGSSASVQALRALGRLLLAEPQQELDRLRERMRKTLGANLGLGPCLLPEFALLLGSMPKVEVDNPVEAESRMIQATVDLLRGVASADKPVVMVLDDLQWAQAVSLRFLDALLTQERSLRGLLIVGAYRSAEVDAAHPMQVMLDRWASLGVSPPVMLLGNLPAPDLGAMIGKMLRLPGEDAERLAQALYDRTDGNPFDTVELINALRRDGLLTRQDNHWQWDDVAIRQHVADCDVVGLLGRRVDLLPTEAREVLDVMACLGGEAHMALLEVACATTSAEIELHLSAALEDGLVVSHQGHAQELHFRHDRVQQAVHERMAPDQEARTQLTLARRLAAHPKFSALAAKQYLQVHHELTDTDECLRVITVFHHSAQISRVVNYELCERFLDAAIAVMTRLPGESQNADLLRRLQTEQHAALYGLGRLDDADRVYEAIVANQPDPVQRVDVAAVQIASLSNRSRHKDAVAIGLALLEDLGLSQPTDLKMAIGMALMQMSVWIAGPDKEQDLTRPELSDPRLLALAKILSKTQVAAFFCAAKIGSWLTMESHRLWVEHGPCPALMATLCSTPMQLIAIGEDYQGAYTLGKHLLKVGEVRGYEPSTSVARFLFAMSQLHWFEPLEDAVQHYRRSREGLFQAGDLQYGIFTYGVWTNLLDTAPNLDPCIEEINGALSVCARSGDHNFLHIFRPSMQLYKTLRGELPPDTPPGAFGDDSFDEAAHEASVATPSTATTYFHAMRGLSAAIFADDAELHRHAELAFPHMSRTPGWYICSHVHLLRALSLCIRLHTTPAQEQAPLVADLDKSLRWLTRRAKDAPFNFGAMQRWIEAEKAWALGDTWAALSGFNTAMDESQLRSRPWQQALITERAGRCHLAQGLAHSGRPLLQAAHDLYERWGALGKSRHLRTTFPELRARIRKNGTESSIRSSIVSKDMVDLLSVLRASQAISSETSLTRLNARVGKVLGAMTGAETVLLALRADESAPWQVFVAEGDDYRTITLEEAMAAKRLAGSAFSYAERTREPLLLNEALRDERFNRDPYVQALPHCSMLLLPVLSKGELRAMLVLENRQSRSAFSTDRLDAVTLVAGQLSVSLDNALLYASLEHKVTERTAALEAANRKLELLSATDGLTGVANRRKFDETLEREWHRSVRMGTPLGLVMLDIDHFKLYNDHYGHQGGDACLKLVASVLADGQRAGLDLVARYGGEEFVLLLINTDAAGTRAVAERVRAAVEALNEPHADSSHGIVTISVGYNSVLPSHAMQPAQFIEQADKALYEAKRSGRNRVCDPT